MLCALLSGLVVWSEVCELYCTLRCTTLYAACTRHHAVMHELIVPWSALDLDKLRCVALGVMCSVHVESAKTSVRFACWW